MRLALLALVLLTIGIATTGCVFEPAEEDVGQDELEASTCRCGPFKDVCSTDAHCPSIKAVAAAGITKGCNPPANDKYCPDAPVTRGQMAAFLRRALGLPTSTCTRFTDVPKGHVFNGDVCAIHAKGITAGCGPNTFCPDEPVTRGQMAAFLTRALGLRETDCNYTDSYGIFYGSACALWKARITTGCNAANNKYCPDAPMTRATMATFLDRAFLNVPTSKSDQRKLDASYLRIATTANVYQPSRTANSSASEILGFVYAYRALRKVQNVPANVDQAGFLAKAKSVGDKIVSAFYWTDCNSSHPGGPGTTTVGSETGCFRLGTETATGENMDRGSSHAIALLELAKLLFEVGDVSAAKKYYDVALRAVIHVNHAHAVTSPCTGWGKEGTFKIKWNVSNRWAVANHLVYRIKDAHAEHVSNAGKEDYRTLAVKAAQCFKDDLRNSNKYRCNGGARCYDSANGPFWTAWHSSYTDPYYAKIEDDYSHGDATLALLFYAVKDDWGVFDHDDLGQFKKHFLRRRQVGKLAEQYNWPQYWMDSDAFRGTCAQEKLGGASVADCKRRLSQASPADWKWYSQNVFSYATFASILGDDELRDTLRRYFAYDGADPYEVRNYRTLHFAAMDLYGEVGTPLRIGN